jgi:hypothetical protein
MSEKLERSSTEEILERLLSAQEHLSLEDRQRLGPAVAGTYDAIVALRGSQSGGDAERLQGIVKGLGHLQATSCLVVQEIVRSRGGQATMAAVRDRLIDMTACRPTTAMAWIEGCVGNGVITDPPGGDVLRLRGDTDGINRS